MTHATFRRGLDQGFVERLNAMYDQPDSWWRAFVDDKDLFLAVRDNYLNVYYRGCSLLKLAWNEGTEAVVGATHYKYLLRPQLNYYDVYVEIADGKPKSLPPVERLFTMDLTDIDALKRASKPYAGPEKTGVHDIVLSNPNVVDIEIGFAGSSVDFAALLKRDPVSQEVIYPYPRRSAGVDFAALQETDRGMEIVFFEAKHFTNQELRAGKDAAPKVIDQIERYSDLLRDNRRSVTDSYRQVCDNLLSLHGLAKRNPERHEMLEDVADGSTPLLVNDEPRLAVFGFDADQGCGKKWKPHRDKLKDKLGDRVLFKGGSKGFTRGISG